MALTECSECGWSVSTGARSCPRCGFEPAGGFTENQPIVETEPDDDGWGDVGDWGASHHSDMTLKHWVGLIVAILALGWGMVVFLSSTDEPRQRPTHVQAEQPEPPPIRKMEPERPTYGEVGYVWSGHGVVTLGVTEEAYDALIDAVSANDEYGAGELVLAGLVFVVDDNTKIRIIETSFLGAYKVRILSGEHEGRAGFLSDQMTFLSPQ